MHDNSDEDVVEDDDDDENEYSAYWLNGLLETRDP
jgi:hypothetical protein